MFVLSPGRSRSRTGRGDAGQQTTEWQTTDWRDVDGRDDGVRELRWICSGGCSGTGSVRRVGEGLYASDMLLP